MANHRLSLEVINVSNPQILKIMDLSIYTALIPVVCPQLLITAPGFQYSASIPEDMLTKGFSLNLTACNLDLQTSNCDSEMNEIPDGIYAIRYAVSPHEYVFVDYNHLRITKALKDLTQLYCDLDLADCLPSKDKEDKLKKLRLIRGMLDAAKAKVEDCLESEKGMTIYNYALKLIEKETCKYC